MVKALRILFLLLVLANLLFFVWGQGYLGTGDDGREPQRLTSELAPDKLRVTDSVPPPSPATTSPVTPPLAENACRMVDGLPLADAKRLHAQAQSEGQFSGLTFTLKPVEVPPGHWVFIPQQASKAAADKKLAELKRRGITNFFLVQDDGIDKLSISLGMFNNQKAAEEYLHVLAGKGVKSATMQLRRRPAVNAQLEVYGPQELLLKMLPELLDGADKAVIAECAEKE